MSHEPRVRGRRASAVAPHALARVALLVLGAVATAFAAGVRADEAPPPPEPSASAEARWATLREHYFDDAEIAPGESLLALDAPARAYDAALVPIAVHAIDPGRAIRRVHLIVDQNPLPLAGVFTFGDGARGWRTLETRIRIDGYTNVRAVAELDDGSLAMVARLVKASGGCSAPPLGDLDAALARAGQMQLLIDEASAASRVEADGASSVAPSGEPLASATIEISHPNSSGMQFDQVTRHYIPAFFVERIEAAVDGQPLIEVETNFSLSENPLVSLTFPGTAARGTFSVRALDSKGNRYEGSAPFASGS